jgi:hypothetical protein
MLRLKYIEVAPRRIGLGGEGAAAEPLQQSGHGGVRLPGVERTNDDTRSERGQEEREIVHIGGPVDSQTIAST